MRVFPRHMINFTKKVFAILFRAFVHNTIFRGTDIETFEKEFAYYCNVRYACGVFSARAGLCLALKALSFQNGDEVILSAFNYYEIPALIKGLGLKSVFVDVDSQTFNIDVSQIEQHITLKTKALLVTHAFGHPCEMEALMNIAKRHNLKVIEDCSHSCGAEYKGQKVGSFGDVSIFSFAMGKNIPCFGGGIIITNNDTVWSRLKTVFEEYTYPSPMSFLKVFLKHFISYGGTHPRFFPYFLYPILRIMDLFRIGISSYHEKPKLLSENELRNYQKRMLNLQAKIGLYQLKRLDAINNTLRKNALFYTAAFKEKTNIKAPIEIKDAKHIYLYYCFTVKNRRDFQRRLLHRGIDIERHHLSDCPGFGIFGGSTTDFPISRMLADESIELPNNIYLTEDDIAFIVDTVREINENLQN